MRKSLLAVMGVVLLLLILGAVASVRGAGKTYVVNSTSDIDDDSCEALPSTADCTLREAIREADDDEVDSTIVFNIPTGDPGYEVSGISGTWTISLTVTLPPLNEGGTIISGTTQAAFIGGDPNPLGPEIEVTGGGMGFGTCLTVASAGNVIHGLVINGCAYGAISIESAGADSNIVSGSYIGTDPTGSSGRGNGRWGIVIGSGGKNNRIGGTMSGEGNVISLNGWQGVVLTGSGTDGNVVCGNYIGTDDSGTLDLGNSRDGVRIVYDAQENTIGPGNLIFGNDWDGVYIEGSLTVSNTITENGIYDNDLKGIRLAYLANGGILAPSIDSATCLSISGTAPANSTVEVFTGPDDEGETYLATCSADGEGNWSVSRTFALDTSLTATATDAAGNTSEFSAAAMPGKCRVFVPLVTKNY